MRYRVSYLIVPETLKRNDAEALETKAYRAASFGLDPLKQSAAVSMAAAMGMYERVVNLDADNLEDVFRLCNSIDKYWKETMPESANAVYLKNGNMRSMSVGDLVDDGAGNYWVVASFGFEPVSIESAKC